VLDDGEPLTENVAILDLVAELAPKLGVAGPLGRTRLIEMLSFLSTELHIAFKPFFHGASEVEEAKAREKVARLLGLLSDRVEQDYLFGEAFGVADAYLFAMLRWANAFDVPMQSEMFRYFERVAARTAVHRALTEEGLAQSLPSDASVGGPLANAEA
jgi:glutathione S-transferase